MATRKPRTPGQKAAAWLASPQGQKATHLSPAMAVAVVAAWQSYWHIVEVATRAGATSHGGAYLLPVCTDAMMVVAAKYITRAHTRLGKAVAGTSFVLGVGATVGANWLAADAGTVAHVVATWPAVAMVVTAAMLHWGEPHRRKAAPRKAAPKAA
jgi:hypothetical protein